MRLSDFTIHDLYLHDELSKYEVEINEDSTVASIIYQHLSSKPGFIRHKRANEPTPDEEKGYLEALHKAVAKGSPIEIFIPAFSPKITNPSVTNGYLYPDMADLLTLIHLHLIAKGVREIYDYGFRFIIGYKGYEFKDFMNWEEEDIKKTYQILNQLKEIAEKIVGTRNVITFVTTKELIEEQGEEFHSRWEKEIEIVKEEYKKGNPYYLRKIDSWTKDFQKAIDISKFHSARELHDFMFYHAVKFRALRNIEYTGGVHNLGICNRFPNVFRASSRGIDKNIGIQISPFFRFHSHQRLIVLSRDNKWLTLKWEEMKNLNSSFVPVYFEEFSHPFYFKEQ